MKKTIIFLFIVCLSATLLAQTDISQVPRYTLIEGFSSSTCPPCNPGNVTLKNFLAQNDAVGGKYTLIKYQMNWPGNGDPYYTAEGLTRRTFYGVNSVPWVNMDGTQKSVTHNNLLIAQAVPSYLEVFGNYNVEEQTVTATIHVRPTMDISVGNNLRLYVAIVEKTTYNNWQTVPNQSNGEKVFYQIMKKFMPDANGITLGNLTACELVTHELTWEFRGNYRLPNNALSPINHAIEHSVEDFSNLEVVAWVQNISNRQLYNSCTAIKGDYYAANFNVNNDNKGTLMATVSGTPIESGDLVPPGTIIDFVANPNTVHYVKGWMLNRCEMVGGKSSNTFSITVDESLTITTIFIRDYAVNFNVTNGNGSLTASANGASINAGDEIEEESVIEFTATPIEGYKVKEWRLNGAVVTGNTSNNYSLILNNDATVTVEFKKEGGEFGTVNFSVVNGNGMLTATADGVSVNSGIELPEGTIVEFIATPNEEYIVKEWKHNDVVVADNTTNNYSLTVSGNETITVEFKKEVGINVNNLTTVKIFPNPVTNELTINNAEHVQKIIITNTLGQIVKEKILSGKNVEVISTQNLQSGIFFITLKNDGGYEVTKKIVKN